MRKRKQFSREEKDFIFKRDHYRCCKCNKNLRRLPEERRLDHKVPFSKGGSDSIENIQLLCAKCDTQKADIITDDAQAEYISIRIAELNNEFEKRKRMFFRKRPHVTQPSSDPQAD